MVQESFAQRKAQILAVLAEDAGDRSRAGGVDAPIRDLIELLNRHPHLYTTSSCSGRITVFAAPDAGTRAAKKKGGEWVFASHERVTYAQVREAVLSRVEAGTQLVFRFEPFILAVECRDMATAQAAIRVARSAGFRESGATEGSHGRVMAGIRCSIRIEAPVADGGRLLVPEDYLRYLVDQANAKFDLNSERIAAFQQLVETVLLPNADNAAAAAPEANEPDGAEAATGGEAGPKVSRAARRRAAKAAAEGGEAPGGRVPYVGKRKQRALERKAQAQADAADGTATAGAAAAGAGAGPVAEAVLDAAAANGIANGKSAPPLPAPATAAAAIGTGGTGAAKHVPAAPPVPASAVAVNDSASAHMPQADPAEPAAVLPFCFTPICDAAEPATCRWSHTACAVGSKMYVFGGYGGQASHQRLNDLRVYDSESGCWSEAAVANNVRPPTRVGHAAVAIGGHIVVIGGRSSPQACLGDVWLLDTHTLEWCQMAAEVEGGGAWPGRFRHSAVAVGEDLNDAKVYVFGGKTSHLASSNETWELTCRSSNDVTWRWRLLPPPSPSVLAPEPRAAHAACIVGPYMYVVGGKADYETQFGDVWRLRLGSGAWERVEAGGEAPRPCFSHTLTPLPGGGLLLLGGCPHGDSRTAHVLNLASSFDGGSGNADGTATADGSDGDAQVFSADGQAAAAARWVQLSLQAPPEFVPVRHTATRLGQDVYLLGGGAFCFSFGTMFGQGFRLQCSPL